MSLSWFRSEYSYTMRCELCFAPCFIMPHCFQISKATPGLRCPHQSIKLAISDVQMCSLRTGLRDGSVQALLRCLCRPAQPPEGGSAPQERSQRRWKVGAQQLGHRLHEHSVQPGGGDASGGAASAAAAPLRHAVSCAAAVCGQQRLVRSSADPGLVHVECSDVLGTAVLWRISFRQARASEQAHACDMPQRVPAVVSRFRAWCLPNPAFSTEPVYHSVAASLPLHDCSCAMCRPGSSLRHLQQDRQPSTAPGRSLQGRSHASGGPLGASPGGACRSVSRALCTCPATSHLALVRCSAQRNITQISPERLISERPDGYIDREAAVSSSLVNCDGHRLLVGPRLLA